METLSASMQRVNQHNRMHVCFQMYGELEAAL